jgi:hypothetical protein
MLFELQYEIEVKLVLIGLKCEVMACIAISTWVAYSGLHRLERFTPMRCNPLKYYGLTKACTVVQTVKSNLGFFRQNDPRPS